MVGTILIILIAEHADEYVWILTGFAAGNLLFLAAGDLLPRIHGTVKENGGVYGSAVAILIGFAVMSGVIYYTHETFGHGHEEAEHGHEDEVTLKQGTTNSQVIEDHTSEQAPEMQIEEVGHPHEDGQVEGDGHTH